MIAPGPAARRRRRDRRISPNEHAIAAEDMRSRRDDMISTQKMLERNPT